MSLGVDYVGTDIHIIALFCSDSIQLNTEGEFVAMVTEQKYMVLKNRKNI
jgi:hypothetical protein